MYKYTQMLVGSVKSVSDILTSYAGQGWEFVSAIPCGSGPDGDHTIIFRRLMTREELSKYDNFNSEDN